MELMRSVVYRSQRSGGRKKPGVEFTVIVWPKHQAGTCLRVLPPDKLEKLVAEIEAMANTDPRKDVLRRVVGGNSEQVTVDKAGRHLSA